jgi:hypothetical protein
MQVTPEKGPTMVFRKEYMLYEKTINPIPPGGELFGWLRFKINIPLKDFNQAETKIHLSFIDTRDDIHYTSWRTLGQANSHKTVYVSWRWLSFRNANA